MPQQKEPSQQRKMRFVGRNIDEQAVSVQQLTIGQSILERFGQQMTRAEVAFIQFAISQFIVPEGESAGESNLEPPTTEQRAEHPAPEQRPTAPQNKQRK